MKIMFDTNVILDVTLFREPYAKVSALLLSQAEQKKLDGYVCATTITTLYYLIEKVKGSKIAKNRIENILNIFKVAEVNRLVLESALSSDIKDYEDAVLHEAGRRQGIDGIVTRNPRDFKKSEDKIFDPEELYKLISM